MHVGYKSSGLEEKDDIFKIATIDENKTLVRNMSQKCYSEYKTSIIDNLSEISALTSLNAMVEIASPVCTGW